MICEPDSVIDIAEQKHLSEAIGSDYRLKKLTVETKYPPTWPNCHKLINFEFLNIWKENWCLKQKKRRL